MVVSAGVWADHMLKARAHPGLRTWAGQWLHNYPASFALEAPVIDITVADADLERLEAVVHKARERGVIMPEGNEYVKARIEVNNGIFDADVRIKGKLTDHVQGRKWSFRVMAKNGGGFHGMKRFSIQHPGTRNYLYDWFYHQLSRSEGIIALRYGFCRVIFNGDDMGIYAYEEHFGPALLHNNARLRGPIIRFDPDLYWVHRLNTMAGLEMDEAYAEYQAAAMDVYGLNDAIADPGGLLELQQAYALLDGFRLGRFGASQVFDVDRMARRHAILDLIGGHHSMDWSDVKFHFDPVAQRVEPISYESFSAFPTLELAGAYKYTGIRSDHGDLHDQLFNDRDLFAAYVGHLERMSRSGWLDSLFMAIGPALDSAAATMYREFPYKEMDRSIYRRNQDAMRRMLAVPKACHAYSQGIKSDTLTLGLVPVNSLPIELLGVALADGREFAAPLNTILPSRPRAGMGSPLFVPFAAPATSDSLLKEGIELICRVLGSGRKMSVKVFPYALPGSEIDTSLLAMRSPNAHEFPFLVFNDVARTISTRPGSWTIDRSLIVPPGYHFVAVAPLRLDLVKGAGIITYSPLAWTGQDEMPIIVTSSDGTGHGPQVIGATGTSQLAHVHFDGLHGTAQLASPAGGIGFHRSAVRFSHCQFTGTGGTLVHLSLGTAHFHACRFAGGDDQLVAQHADIKAIGCQFTSAVDDILTMDGGRLDIRNTSMTGAGGVALKVGKGGSVHARSVSIGQAASGILAREGANMAMEGGSITGGTVGVEARENEMRFGAVKIDLNDVRVEGSEDRFKCGAGSTIKLDGKRVGVSRNAEGT